MGIKAVIQKVLPQNIRSRLLQSKSIDYVNRKINVGMIKKLYKNSNDPEMGELLNYIRKSKGKTISGVLVQQELVYDYLKKDIKVENDGSVHLSYVVHNGKRMYFPKTMSDEAIKNYYRSNLLEQDNKSAHCYFTDMSIYPEGGVFVDLGAAEGNFSLDLLDRAGHIYLFEGDENWIEALRATFSPWQDKVTIVPKYVGNKKEEKYVTLSDYFGKEKHIDVIKMDIEGAEVAVIQDNVAFFESHDETVLVVCVYHKENDEADIKKLMPNHYFREQGWIMGSNRNVLHPYVRRVLMFGKQKRQK